MTSVHWAKAQIPAFCEESLQFQHIKILKTNFPGGHLGVTQMNSSGNNTPPPPILKLNDLYSSI
jgi:hypothetical protein